MLLLGSRGAYLTLKTLNPQVHILLGQLHVRQSNIK